MNTYNIKTSLGDLNLQIALYEWEKGRLEE